MRCDRWTPQHPSEMPPSALTLTWPRLLCLHSTPQHTLTSQATLSMSAASVQSPLTTTYIQSPSRFSSTREVAAALARRQSQGPAPASYYANGGVVEFEGKLPVVRDDQPNPVVFSPAGGNPHALQDPPPTLLRPRTPPQAMARIGPSSSQRQTPNASNVDRYGASMAKAPRSNGNSRTSAGFPLAVTAQQKQEAQQRQLAARLDWEEEHERAQEAAHQAAERAAEAADLARLERDQFSPNKKARDAAQAALHARQKRDCKLPFSERVAPPRPDFAEDPFTAKAAEHTGIFPGAIKKDPPERTPFEYDHEPAAPEGSEARRAQRLRSNPLLDPLYSSKNDAAGLGYGRTHRSHFRYISHWTASGEADSLAHQMATQSVADGGTRGLDQYRSKDHLGYRPEVRALGWGSPHPCYNSYISVRRASDILKDYPDRSTCEQFLHRKD